MTPKEAHNRIALSRDTLARYTRMTSVGVHSANGTATMVAEEISILKVIAEEHPDLIESLARLIRDWLAFREGFQSMFN